MEGTYEIVLDKFSGPLDLLLHLIQKQELDIHDIPIALITEQYMTYLHAMEELSLEVTSEFIVMAATLLAIKSRMLLPKPPVTPDEEEALDPREQLVLQLLEYQRCKIAATQLKEMGSLQSQVFSREPMDLSPYAPTDPPRVEGVSMWDLVDAFRKLMKRVPEKQHVAEIRGHVVSVGDMMQTMQERLKRFRQCTFIELMQGARSRAELVSGFLALLELVKDRLAVCLQRLPFDDILISSPEAMNDAGFHDSAS
jgi:segregation and condensation protein A